MPRLSDEQRAWALEWARRLDEECPSGHWPYHRLALDLADELAASRNENAELRRGLQAELDHHEVAFTEAERVVNGDSNYDSMDYHHERRLTIRALLAGEVQE